MGALTQRRRDRRRLGYGAGDQLADGLRALRRALATGIEKSFEIEAAHDRILLLG
jgi:hypothetical protein